MFKLAEFLLVKQNIVRSVAEFIDYDWEDKVNSGVGLSYRAARLHGLGRAGTTTLCRS
jgi:hypothetical protein